MNYYDRKIRELEDRIISLEGEVKRLKPKRTRFEPPNMTELINYISENDLQVDAYAFKDFYESKNWMVGKNKMKDWKAAVRNWSRGNKSETQPKRRLQEI